MNFLKKQRLNGKCVDDITRIMKNSECRKNETTAAEREGEGIMLLKKDFKIIPSNLK